MSYCYCERTSVGAVQRYVALLRGIAPSGRNMGNDKLREVVRRCGGTDVASVLASGNIVFSHVSADASALERRVEETLTAHLGLTCTAILRTDAELRTLLATDPFPGLDHSPRTYLTATFLKDPPTTRDAVPAQPDARTTVVGFDESCRAVLAVSDNSDPGAAATYVSWLERTYGKRITTRSWLSVQRISRVLDATPR